MRVLIAAGLINWPPAIIHSQTLPGHYAESTEVNETQFYFSLRFKTGFSSKHKARSASSCLPPSVLTRFFRHELVTATEITFFKISF